jgi:hypothetical protein
MEYENQIIKITNKAISNEWKKCKRTNVCKDLLRKNYQCPNYGCLEFQIEALKYKRLNWALLYTFSR